MVAQGTVRTVPGFSGLASGTGLEIRHCIKTVSLHGFGSRQCCGLLAVTWTSMTK